MFFVKELSLWGKNIICIKVLSNQNIFKITYFIFSVRTNRYFVRTFFMFKNFFKFFQKLFSFFQGVEQFFYYFFLRNLRKV